MNTEHGFFDNRVLHFSYWSKARELQQTNSTKRLLFYCEIGEKIVYSRGLWEQNEHKYESFDNFIILASRAMGLCCFGESTRLVKHCILKFFQLSNFRRRRVYANLLLSHFGDVNSMFCVGLGRINRRQIPKEKSKHTQPDFWTRQSMKVK